MATVTRLKLGPKDHGRPLTYADYLEAEYQSGYQYEIIDGKLEVAAQPRMSHGILDKWLSMKLDRYSDLRPDIANMVYNKVRILVPGRAAASCPEPDLAAYRNLPLEVPIGELDWEDVYPFLVVEILSPENVNKDLVRNVELYWQVPSIREYWVVDGLADSNQPSLRVYRRRGKRWQIIDVAYGDTYTTKLLPEFELAVDPRLR